MKRLMQLPVAVVGLIVLVVVGLNLGEYVDASEIVLVQSLTGELTWHTTPGPVWQGLGKITSYKKRGILVFTKDGDTDGRLPVVFNDAGKGSIKGSISYELPLDAKSLTDIHQFYPTQDALEAGLIRPALNKSVYMTGPLMSSYESIKERRPQLISYVEDQIQNGVFATEVHEREVADELDPTSKKRVTVVEIMKDGGVPRRVEKGQLARFNIRAFGFAIEDLDYDDNVDKQIQQQQTITMQVQTAIAQAKQAVQQKITATAQGEAEAEKVKWLQEAQNSKIVAEAEGRKKAAEQDALAADAEKRATLLRASAEAEARRMKMQADGALEQKLATLRSINEVWAHAFANSKNPVVPGVVMGGGAAGNGAGNVQTLMEVLTAKAAKDLAVEVGVKQ